MPGEARRLAREIDEHLLDDVFGQMRVSPDLPQRRRIDKVEVCLHQLRERRFVAISDIPAKQVTIIHGWFVQSHQPAAETGQKLFLVSCLPAKTKSRLTG